MESREHSNPYVGPRTFEKEDAELFFGREREAKALLTLVASQRLVLFYAQSGAGKSSLINTRLIPGLKERGFVIWPVGRVTGELPTYHQVSNLFVFNLLLKLDEDQHDAMSFNNTSLAEYITSWNPAVTTEVDATPRGRVLIIDQFEELLTSHRERWQDREDFFQQLEDAMQADPLLWVVLTLREDHVAPLDVYAPLLTNRLRARFYMQRLDSAAALQAITKPAEKGGRPFAPGVAQQLIDNLRQLSERERQRTSKLNALGEFIEPVQLQVVCQRLWTNLSSQPRDWITFDDITELGDVNTALADFYEQAIARTEQDTGVNRFQLRTWIEKKLITEGGTRGTVVRGKTTSGDLLNVAVDSLARQFLLREEPRAGGIWYELIHDRFIEPIQQSNQRWRANQSPLVQAAIEWNDTGRRREKLYRGDLLTEILKSVQISNLPDVGRDFLEASSEYQDYLDREDAANLLDQQKLEIKAQQALLAKDEAERLLKLTQEKNSYQRRKAMLFTGFLTALTVLVILFFATLSWTALIREVATDRASIAMTAQAESEIARQDAEIAQAESERLYRNVRANQLAIDANHTLQIDPDLALLLAYHAVNVTFESDGTFVPQAYSALLNALAIPPHEDLQGLSSNVLATFFSPDGQMLLTSSEDGRVTIWDTGTGEQRFSFILGGLPNAHFSPDGTHVLATTNINDNIQVWDTSSGDQIFSFRSNQGAILYSTFSPNGNQLVTTGIDGTSILWDAKTGEQSFVLVGHTDEVAIADYSPDGTWLLTGSKDTTAKLWDTETGELLTTFKGHVNAVTSADFNRMANDNVSIVTGSDDKTAIIWDIPTGEALSILSLHQGRITSVLFSPDGNTILTTGTDGVGWLWNARTGIAIGILRGHSGSILTASFSADSQRIVTGGADFTARVWSTTTQQQLLLLDGYSAQVNAVAFDHDGARIVTGSSDGTLRIWHTASENSIFLLRGHIGNVYSLAFNPIQDQLISAGEDGVLRLWDTAAGNLEKTFEGHTSSVLKVDFDPQGKYVVSASSDGTARIWDTGNGGESIILKHDNWVLHALFSPDGQYVVTASADNTAKVWNVRTGEHLITLEGHTDDVNDATFSPDGSLIITASNDDTARIWDATTGINIWTFLGHKNDVVTASFSPDGKQVITASSDGTAGIWNVETGTPEFFLEHLESPVIIARFSPDGKWILTVSRDAGARLWNATNWRKMADLFGDPGESILAGDFSPDSRFVFLGNNFGRIFQWNAENGRLQATLSGDPNIIRVLEVDPTTNAFATGNADGIVRLWPITQLNALLQEAEIRLTRGFTDEECETYFRDELAACPQNAP